MKENFARVNGINLHYVEEGEGDLVILLHGFPDFWYGWRHQIPVLSREHHIVAPDMRGYNLSDKPNKLRDYRVDVLATDIAELIRALGEKHAVVVGHDWGGTVAWALAAYYPELVRKLIIINAPYPTELVRALGSGNFAQWRKSYYMFLFQIPKIPEWFIGRNLERFFKSMFKAASPRSHVSESIITRYVEAYSKPKALSSPINYYREGFRALGRMRLRNKVPLPMPVLVLWGEKDVALGKELTFNTNKYCSDLEIVYDPESGHFLQLDNPGLVNGKILEFLNR